MEGVMDYLSFGFSKSRMGRYVMEPSRKMEPNSSILILLVLLMGCVYGLIQVLSYPKIVLL